MTQVLGFTPEQASRVTGLSLRQLRYWDKTGFFSPNITTDMRRTYAKLYSFRNLVGLRTIALLRNTHHIPLQELRKVGKWLAQWHETPWASLRLYVTGRRILFEDPSTGALLASRPANQTVFPIEMTRVAHDTEQEVQRLRARQPGELGEIGQNRYVVRNQPVVAGTRVPTSAIWNLHAAGYDAEAIRAEYPHLADVDIAAALAFEQERRARKAG